MAKKEQAKEEAKGGSREEQIGFHKGALTTLAKERQELMRILQIVEQLMQVHIKALQGLGVDLQKIATQAKESGKGTSRKIDEIV